MKVEVLGRPAQLTLGDGGTQLDPADQGGPLPTFGPPGIPAPTQGVTTFTFGWTLLHPGAEQADPRDVVAVGVRELPIVALRGWTQVVTAGTPSVACRLAPHEIDCKPSS